MNVVFIIPTGIGCEIGGDAGDASPSAKLIASVCDKLIIHPNVVNASDINEMTDNMLYVEGSMLDRFLEGEIELQEVKSNKILVVTNSPIKNQVINSVSAARTTIGLDASILVLETPLRMIGRIEDNQAVGDVIGWEQLVEQVKDYDFDALAITTPIEVDDYTHRYYLEHGGVNPWGGIEAKTSKLIANALNKPVAHSPSALDDDNEFLFYNEIVDPRMSAEMVSISYLHCILKGLHKAPRIGSRPTPVKVLSVRDVDVMISPYGCFGRPHIACRKAGIPIIGVKENKTTLKNVIGCFIFDRNFIVVENYLEAVGVIKAIDIGITLESIRRPIKPTRVY